MTSSRFIAVCTLIVATAVTERASAQRSASDIETARRLYNEGIELRDNGDMKDALAKFRVAHALGNTPITGIELCKAHAALVQPVEAREVCLGVARIPPMPQETARSQDARGEAGRIAEEQRPKIGALRLTIKGVPEGREATVMVDGFAVSFAALLRSPVAISLPCRMRSMLRSSVACKARDYDTACNLFTRAGTPLAANRQRRCTWQAH